jgi:hypothetical protein
MLILDTMVVTHLAEIPLLEHTCGYFKPVFSTIIRKLVMVGYADVIKEKAAEKYLSGKVTLSEAAHQAGLTVWEMEQYLVGRGFKSSYSIDDLERETRFLG